MSLLKFFGQQSKSTDQFTTIPSVTTTPSNIPNGLDSGLAYDNTTNKLYYYKKNTAVWTDLDTSVNASTLNDVYDNAGNKVIVDGSDVWFEATANKKVEISGKYAGTIATLLLLDNEKSDQAITDALKITISGAGTGSIVDAIDVSDSRITNALNAGANRVLGTAWSINSDGAIATTGQLTAGGISAISSDIICKTLTATTVSGVTSLSLTGLTVTGTAVFNGANPAITTSATTGNGLYVDGSTVTSGNVLRVEADATALNGGKLINATLDNVSKFSVGEDGTTTIAGTAAGSNSLVMTAGDLTMTSGHLIMTSGNATMSQGKLDITQATTNANAVAVTGSGARTVALFSVTDTPGNGGITFDINATTSNNAAIIFDIDVTGTYAANVIDMAFASAYTGKAINLNMTNAVAGEAIDITGAGTRTAALVKVVDTPASGGITFDVDVTTGNNAARVFDIDVTGTHSANVIDVAFASAFTGDAIALNLDNAVSAQAFTVDASDFVGAANLGMVHIATTGSGARAQYSNILRVIEGGSGTPAGATNGLCIYASDSSAAAATSYAMYVASKSNEGLKVAIGKSVFVEQIALGGGCTLSDSQSVKFGTGASDLDLSSNGTNVLFTNKLAAKFGSNPATNYTQIATDGTLTFAGTAKPKARIFLPAASFADGSDAAAVVWSKVGTGSGPSGWSFSATTDSSVSAGFVVPSDMAVTSDIQAYIHWATSDTAHVAKFKLITAAVADGEAFTTNADSDIVTDTCSGTVNTYQKTPVVTIATSAFAAGDYVPIRVVRDRCATDTVTSTVEFLGLELVYTRTQLGQA